jgi:hypothetical protein
MTNKGSLHQTSKIVRLDSLQKPIAFRKPTAIPLCNADFQAFGQMKELLHKPSFAQSEKTAFRSPHHPNFRERDYLSRFTRR